MREIFRFQACVPLTRSLYECSVVRLRARIATRDDYAIQPERARNNEDERRHSRRDRFVRGARQNNLKNLEPRRSRLNELVVVTGVSGSGKSSLVFDTLYAEGQRRYVETFSPYARQFLDRMDKPQVDAHRGHSAGDRDRPDEPGAHLALDRRHDDGAQRSPEAAVRARGDSCYCRGCGKPVRRDTPESHLRGPAVERAQAAGDPRLLVTLPGPGAEELQGSRSRATCSGAGLHAHPRSPAAQGASSIDRVKLPATGQSRVTRRRQDRPRRHRRAARARVAGSRAARRAGPRQRPRRRRSDRRRASTAGATPPTCTAPTATSTTASRRRACSRSTRRSAPARRAAASAASSASTTASSFPTRARRCAAARCGRGRRELTRNARTISMKYAKKRGIPLDRAVARADAKRSSAGCIEGEPNG